MPSLVAAMTIITQPSPEIIVIRSTHAKRGATSLRPLCLPCHSPPALPHSRQHAVSWHGGGPKIVLVQGEAKPAADSPAWLPLIDVAEGTNSVAKYTGV